LRALYIHRDQRAQALDRPPFKVLGDRVLLDMSKQRPRSLSELAHIRGLPRRLPSRERRRLLSVIGQGLRDDPPQKPIRESRDRRDEAAFDRYEALRRWRKERAETRGVEPDVVLSNRTLHVLARRNPTSPEALAASGLLNDWERQEYGREIVALLRRQKRIGKI
jgi:ribonuclease D